MPLHSHPTSCDSTRSEFALTEDNKDNKERERHVSREAIQQGSVGNLRNKLEIGSKKNKLSKGIKAHNEESSYLNEYNENLFEVKCRLFREESDEWEVTTLLTTHVI